MGNTAIILFGGVGERFDKDIKKQFFMLGKYPLCYYATRILSDCDEISRIIVVSEENSIEELSFLLYRTYKFNKISAIIPGGISRQESVCKALKYLKQEKSSPDELILIQDGDRPNLSEALVRENLRIASSYGASVTAIEATDSLLYAEEDEAREYLKREKIYQVQTPQCFRFDWIYKAHMAAHEQKLSYTDDASMLSLLGKSAHIVKGSHDNIKITSKIDAEIFMKEKEHAS